MNRKYLAKTIKHYGNLKYSLVRFLWMEKAKKPYTDTNAFHYRHWGGLQRKTMLSIIIHLAKCLQ